MCCVLLRTSSVAACSALFALGAGDAAANTRPGQWEIGVAPTYAYLVRNSRSEPKGAGASVYVAYGISRLFAIKLSGLWTVHEVGDDDGAGSGAMHIINAALGLTYEVDLVRFSPKIEAAAGVLHRHTSDASETDFGFKIGVGLDYLVTSWLTVGGGIHYHAFLSDPTDIPVFVEIGPRVAFLLD